MHENIRDITPYTPPNSDPTERVELLRTQLEESSRSTAADSNDYHSACSSALLETLEQTDSRAVLVKHLERRKVIKPGEILSTWALERLVTTGIDMIVRRELLTDGEIHYTPAHRQKDVWLPVTEQSLGGSGPNNSVYASFKQVVEILDLNRIRGERRCASEFVLATCVSRWQDEPIGILDIGCSRGDLLLMTAMNEPHDLIILTDTPDDNMYNQVFNRTINQPSPPLGLKHGVDIHPPDDELFFGEWFESNCLRFNKIEDAHMVRTIERLGSVALRREYNIEQFSADFSRQDIGLMHSVNRASTFAESYHLMIASFVYDYLDRQRRSIAIQHGFKRLAPNGIHIVQGFIAASTENPLEFEVLDSDSAGCTTLGFDNTNKKSGWQNLFHWNDGGCTKGTIGNSPLSEELWSSALNSFGHDQS